MAISEDTANACAEEAQEEDKPLSTEQGGNMDKIRDILFGAQMREYETRFARLEESLQKESADLRDTTKRRFDALESYVKKEMEALQSRVKAERDERSDSVRRLSRDLSEASESLSKRIGDLDERTSQADGNLWKTICVLLETAGDLAGTNFATLTCDVFRRDSTGGIPGFPDEFSDVV